MESAIQNARRVAFQGEPGAYANLAAREALPHAAYIPCPTFEDAAVNAVRGGDTDLCIIPVENSLMGRIADIHHLLPDAGLHIVGEHFLRIQHQLLGIKGARIAGLKSVYSQGPALAQCLNVIRRELNLKAENWHDTAGSAKYVAELKDPAVAAIASEMAGELYGLDVLQSRCRGWAQQLHALSHHVTRARRRAERRPPHRHHVRLPGEEHARRALQGDGRLPRPTRST